MLSRFAPPNVREPLVRARLLAVLRGRFERRVTAVVAGPGFGKTTLLTQAVAENRLDPAGYDVWLGCDRDDSAASTFGSGLCAALEAASPDAEQPDAVSNAVATALARRAPTSVAIVLDDVHEIERDSGGAEVLARLVEDLPLNAHLVLASRRALPIPLARLVARGQAVRLDESALAFDDDELDRFGELRGVSGQALQDLGRWPALAELVATAGGPSVHEFLWEELLAAMAPEQRRHLAVLAAIGGGDTETLSAAAGTRIDLDELVAGLPLVDQAAGRCDLHALWHEPLTRELDEPERRRVVERAGRYLLKRGDSRRAFHLLADAEAWEPVREVFLEVSSITHEPVPTDVLASWLARVPRDVAAGPEGRLVSALIAKGREVDPALTIPLIEDAARTFAEHGDVRGELACLPHLAHLGFWAGNRELVSGTVLRAMELEARGHSDAAVLAMLGRALSSFVSGQYLEARGELERVRAMGVGGLEELAGSLAAETAIALGEPEAAVAIATPIRAFRPIAADTLPGALWLTGRVDEALGALPPDDELSPISRQRQAAWSQHSRFAAFVDDGDRAREYMARCDAVGPPASIQVRARVAMARAAIALTNGDEPGATAALAELVDDYPPGDAPAWHALRRGLALVYVLLPSTRPYWQDATLGSAFATGRALADAVASLRDGSLDGLEQLEVPDTGVVRAWLPLRWAMHLAAGLAAAGRNEGPELADALGSRARPSLQQLSASVSRPVAAAAGHLLARLPTEPPFHLEIRALGPMELRRDGTLVDAPDLRRERVRALLGYLILHRRATREAIAIALWPDLETKPAGNNLRVNLSYLTRALEPDRGEGAPAFFVRQARETLELGGAEHLLVDTWEFDRLISEAGTAERDGALSVARDRYAAAADAWRGPLLADVDAEWVELERERFRVRWLEAATRAGELALASGDVATPEMLARRVLEVEPWSERGYRLLAEAHLSRGDRPAARRTVERCRAMLSELGVEAEAETRMLERRLAEGGTDAG